MFRIENRIKKESEKEGGKHHHVVESLFSGAMEIDEHEIRYYVGDVPEIVSFENIKEVNVYWHVDRYGAGSDVLEIKTYMGHGIYIESPTFSGLQIRAMLNEIKKHQKEYEFIINKRTLPGSHDESEDSPDIRKEMEKSKIRSPELEAPTATKIVLKTEDARNKAAIFAVISGVFSTVLGYAVFFDIEKKWCLVGLIFSLVVFAVSTLLYIGLRKSERTYFVDRYGVRAYNGKKPLVNVDFSDVKELGNYLTDTKYLGIYMDSENRRILDDISVGFPIERFRELFIEMARNAREYGIEINDPAGWFDHTL